MAGLEGKILGRYELRRIVGRGGMADVYEGYDPHFERMVAVKVFKRDDEEMLRRFIKEAHLMASLHNEHLLQIYDSGESSIDGDPWYYIIMPFMEGGTLRARIRRSPLSLVDACRVIRDIAAALDYIHSQGIIHRDIKSSNVLLSADGRCYLADFGIARITTDVTQLTSTGNVLGTVDYVAPELFEVNRKANARSDLYSLGVLLFEMVTGQMPFRAENQIALVSMHMNKRPPSPRSISPDIPVQVERVILKALEKKPEQRYASATELAETFCRAVSVRSKKTAQERSGLSKPVESEALVPLVAADQQASVFPATGGSLLTPLRPSPLADAPRIPPTVAVRSSIGDMPTEAQQVLPLPKPPQSPRFRPLLIAGLALLALLLVSVPIFLVLMTHGKNGNNPQGTASGQTQTVPTATPNLTATARAAVTATAVVQHNATSTAVAGVTATVQAQASATAGVIQTATAGTPVYQDTLKNPNNPDTQAAGWDQSDQCAFQPDGYHVKKSVNLFGNFQVCHESNTYRNATIAVDVNLLSGHSGGLFFRLTSSLGDFGYLFKVDSAGNYKISAVSGSSLSPLQDWKSSAALKKGYNVQNTLQVIASDSTFSFYINGVFLVQLTDTAYSSGVIGFLATTTNGGADTEVVYSNLKVYLIS